VYPRYCLQRLWLDYPGCADIYECLTFNYDCLYEVPSEGLWYGCPTEGNELPEDCDYSCESGGWGGGKGYPPPHGWALNTKQKAWDKLNAGLTAAGIIVNQGDAQYYMIPQSQSGVGRPVWVIAVKVPTGSSPRISGDRYLCIETDPLSRADSATFPNKAKQVGPGAQLTIDYQVGSETRTAFVYLKSKPGP
jgi:hypothetical protein